MRASVNIFLGRARNELPIAVKPRAVARAVPAGFVWIPLQLTAQMWATNVHYMEGISFCLWYCSQSLLDWQWESLYLPYWEEVKM